MSEAASEDRVDPEQLLELQGKKAANDQPTDPSTEESRGAIETWIEHEVDDRKIATSTNIVRDLDSLPDHEFDDVRPQQIGRTLGVYHEGNVEDESFASDVEISIWRDSNQTMWQFDRVAGSCESEPETPRLRDDVIEDIAAGIDGAPELSRTSKGRLYISIGWMRTVARELLERVDADEDVFEELETASKRGVTEIVARHAGVERVGARDQWSKGTLTSIHEQLTGGDQA